MKPKLMSYGLGLLKLSQSQTSYLISSKENGRISYPTSATFNFEKFKPSITGHTTRGDLK